MDMLVKLYDLPDYRASVGRLNEQRIRTRRASAEKHKVTSAPTGHEFASFCRAGRDGWFSNFRTVKIRSDYQQDAGAT
jgi:hypothetical protein